MNEQRIGKQALEIFKQYLILEEKSKVTIDKYIRDINKFLEYLKEEPVTKERIIGYKEYLQKNYKVKSINTMLASLNSFFRWLDRPEFRIKQLKVQQSVFIVYICWC